MVVHPGLCGTRSETPKTGFLTTRLIYESSLTEEKFIDTQIICLIKDSGNKKINDDSGLTLTYLMASSKIAYAFEWRKLLKSHLMGKNLQQLTD